MSHFIHTEADLAAATTRLIAADRRLVAAHAIAGQLPLRRRPGGFEGLASIVVSQQLSTASAAAILGRLTAAIDPFDHAGMLQARTPKLRRVGLSMGKIRTLRAIARAIRDGVLDPEKLADMPADDAHQLLMQVHGIGPWTADIYLLTCVGHADAWPAGDLALQEAARLALALKKRPTTKEMGPLAEPWRPWRGVAARLLWTYYRAVKGRSGAPVIPKSEGDSPDGRAQRSAARAARGRGRAPVGRVPARLRRRRQ